MSTFAAVAQYDESDMEGEITSWVREEQGLHGVTVDCGVPRPVRTGQDIICTATDRFGDTAPNKVTFAADTYTWNWAN